MSNTQEILDLARRDIAARRAAAETARSYRPWLWAFVALSSTVLLGLLLLPVRGLDYRLQMLVHGVCAQAHYLEIGALRMPLCARNTGIYAGSIGTIFFLLASGRGVILSGRLDDNFSFAGRQQSITGRYNFTDDEKNIPAAAGKST